MTDPADDAPRRLSPEARRAQLVAVGLELSRTTPLDQVAVEDIAAAAGTSKALVFHYFPTKRDLQVAIVQASAAELLASLDPGEDLAYGERLRVGLERFIDFIEPWPLPYSALTRSAGSDVALLAVFEDSRNAIAAVILDALGVSDPSPTLRLALRGWIAMAEEVILQWIDHRPVERAEVVRFLARSALRVLAEALVLDGAPLDGSSDLASVLDALDV